MKKFLLAALGMLVALSCLANLDNVPLTITAASTNTTAIGANDVTTNTSFISGYVYALYVDVTGIAPDVDLDLVTIDGQTIFSIDDITADAWYFPRETPDTTAGVEYLTNGLVEIPLSQDRIELSVYDALTNATTGAKVTLYYDQNR